MSPTYPRGLRLVVGAGSARNNGIHAELALRLTDVARGLGFAIQLKRSRATGSPSFYLYATGPDGRCWRVRISNHRCPADAAVPHLDLVSLDGVAGAAETRAFLVRVLAGEIAWFDSEETGRTASALQRKRWGRR